MSTTASITTIGSESLLVANVQYDSLSWVKRLDTFGTAQMAVSAQCVPPQLLGTHPWVHELRIDVDGELGWVGPIRYVVMPLNDNSGTQLIIEAYEISYWFALRFARLAIDYTDTNTPVSDVVRQIATAAISPDDPKMLDFLEVLDCETVHDREVKPNDNAWSDHLRDVVGSLMHMRSHGRSVSFWCYGECLGVLPRVRADQFEGFNNLVYDGERFATDVAVYGAGEKDQVAAVEFDPGPPVIEAKPAQAAVPEVLGLAIQGGSSDFPGVRVERTYRDTSYLNDESAARFAENAVVRRSPLGTADQDDLRAETRCDSPWPISRVAPGMCTTVGSRYGEHAMQIDSVSGKVEANGIETFSIGFNELLGELPNTEPPPPAVVFPPSPAPPVAPPSPWAPTRLESLEVWIPTMSDPTQLVLDGTNVTQMLDKSGNGKNYSDSSGGLAFATFGSRQINSIDVMDWNANSLQFDCDVSWSPTGPMTVCIVLQSDFADSTRAILGDTTTQTLGSGTSGAGSYRIRGANNRQWVSPGPDLLPHVVTYVIDGANSIVRVDGVPDAGGVQDVGALDFGAAHVFGRGGGSNAFNGGMGEIVVCSAALSGSDLFNLEAYMAVLAGT